MLQLCCNVCFSRHKARVQFDKYIDMIAAGNEEAVTKQLAKNRLQQQGKKNRSILVLENPSIQRALLSQ